MFHVEQWKSVETYNCGNSSGSARMIVELLEFGDESPWQIAFRGMFHMEQSAKIGSEF